MNQPATLPCPRCQLGLHVAHASGATLHGCGGCGGIWVDLQTGHRLCEALDGDARALADSAEQYATHAVDTALAAVCPICAQALTRSRVQNAGVDIDYCPTHGTWFDRGELQKIAQATAIQRAYGAPTGAAPTATTTAAGASAAAVVASDDDSVGDEVAEVAIDVGVGIIGGLLESLFD